MRARHSWVERRNPDSRTQSSSRNPIGRKKCGGSFEALIKRRLGQPYAILLPDGRKISAVEVAAEIIRKLKRDAERHFEGPASRAVITHPAVFSPMQRKAIVQAAKLAGFTQVELLEEPVAAAVAYCQIGKRAGSGFLVYDFGGGTFDLAVVVRESDGSYHSAIEPDGDPTCGGDDLDELLYGYWEEQIKREYGQPIAPNGTRDAWFLRECRNRKENLSEQKQCTFQSVLPGGTIAKLKIDRAAFVRLIAPVIDRTVQKTKSMLGKASQRRLKIDSVILVGGSSGIPMVAEKFHEAIELLPHTFGRKDFAVVMGAAYSQRKPAPKHHIIAAAISHINS